MEVGVVNLYEKNAIETDYGATKQTFVAHMLEYFINKVKWDSYFSKKELFICQSSIDDSIGDDSLDPNSPK